WRVLLRDKKIIEPHVRVPRGKCPTLFRMQHTVAIDVSAVEHHLYRAVDHSPAEHHCEQPVAHGQPFHVEQLAGGERIKIARKQMKFIVERLKKFKQRPYLSHSAAFGVVRVRRSQVNAENTHAVKFDLEHGTLHLSVKVPLVTGRLYS